MRTNHLAVSLLVNATENRAIEGSFTFYIEVATGRTLIINQYNVSNNNSGLYFRDTASDYHDYKRVNIVGPLIASNMLRVGSDGNIRSASLATSGAYEL